MINASAESAPRNGLFAALGHRNFRVFFLGQGVSLIGTWMQSTAQAWLVLTLTNSPFLLGVISAFQFTPVLLFSLVGGALADRFPKRRLLLFTQSTLMVQAFILSLLTWTGTVRYWHVAVLALLLGFVNSLDMPARQAFFVEMVERADLMNAIALNSALVNGGRIIGPAIAGFVIAHLGTSVAFLLNGMSFTAVLMALAQMVTPPFTPAPRLPLLGHIGEGLRYVVATPQVMTALALVGALNIAVLNFSNVSLPVLVRSVLGGDARIFGLLVAAMGIGSLVGALILATMSRAGPRRAVIYAGALIVSLAAGFMGFARSFTVAVTLALLAGFSMILFASTSNSFVQVQVPDELRGRVMSVYMMLSAGSTPLGAMLTGGIMGLWGAQTGFLAASILGVAATLFIGLWDRRSTQAPALDST